MPICELCQRAISDGAERITLPVRGGIITICMPCATAPRGRLQGGAVVVDKDGELPVEVKDE